MGLRPLQLQEDPTAVEPQQHQPQHEEDRRSARMERDASRSPRRDVWSAPRIKIFEQCARHSMPERSKGRAKEYVRLTHTIRRAGNSAPCLTSGNDFWQPFCINRRPALARSRA